MINTGLCGRSQFGRCPSSDASIDSQGAAACGYCDMAWDVQGADDLHGCATYDKSVGVPGSLTGENMGELVPWFRADFPSRAALCSDRSSTIWRSLRCLVSSAMMMAILLLGLFLATSAGQPGWVPALPDREGFAGMFAGVTHGVLLAAGGANFPDKKPWEGGAKVWHDTVYLFDPAVGVWKICGKLPRQLAYGVSVTYRNEIVCVGGSNANGHFADVFRLVWTDGALAITAVAPLPMPLAFACGAVIDDTLFVAGGQGTPDSLATSRAVFRIRLDSPQPRWEEVEPLPDSGRMLAMAASLDNAFYVVGGVDLIVGHGSKPERKYLGNGFRYRPGRGWSPIANLPRPLAAAPSPAPAVKDGFYLLGGDDGMQLRVAPGAHKGFSNSALFYDKKLENWRLGGDYNTACVTAPCVPWYDAWVVLSGEIRPGIRSPGVFRFIPNTGN